VLIILEGCDATGKTTVARELAEDWGFELRHHGPPDRHPLEEWGQQIADYKPTDRWVMDRFHWGELVYAPHYRNRTDLGWHGFEWVEQALRSRGAITVHCTGDPQRILDRATALEDDYVDLSLGHITLLLQVYRTCVTRSHTVWYEHDIDGARSSSRLFAATAEGRQRATYKMLTRHPQVIGQTVRPRYLLVGDRIGPEQRAPTLLPFGPWPDSSGSYLMRAILEEGLKDYALTNAYTPDGTPYFLHRLWLDLGRPKVVALGNEAANVLDLLNVPFGKTVHPQAARRFNHHQLTLYGRTLRAAAEEQCVYTGQPGKGFQRA
jgi:hypothetical protein